MSSQNAQPMIRFAPSGKPVLPLAPARPRAPLLAGPWLMSSTALAGVAISCGVAAIGVAGLIGFQSNLAKAGTVALVALTIATEIANLRLPLHAERRFAAPNWASKAKGLTIVGGFLLLECWNVYAADLGAQAISDAGVADKRAPLAAAYDRDSADADAAQTLLGAYSATAAQDTLTWGSRLAAAPAAAVTAGAKLAHDAEVASELRSAHLERLTNDLAGKRAARDSAKRALDAAPKGYDGRWTLALGLLLSLIKGALVWMATGGERRAREDEGATDLFPVERLPCQMSPDELDRVITFGRQISASAQHERKRRRDAAANIGAAIAAAGAAARDRRARTLAFG